jgi:cytochrome c oxidase subunit II
MGVQIDSLEKRFVWLTIGALVVGIVAIIYSVQEIGIHLPDRTATVDPMEVARGNEPPFDAPGLYQVGPNQYEAVVIARAFSFDTGETMTVQDAATGRDMQVGVLRIPQGATVDFIATSQDVLHGMKIVHTNVNIMLIPGEVSRVRHTFTESTELQLLCMEYCGLGHSQMFGKVIVE